MNEQSIVATGRVNDIGAPTYEVGSGNVLEFKVGMNVLTKKGRKVEIIHVAPSGQEFTGGDAIIGILDSGDGDREVMTWQRNGVFDPKRITTLDLLPPVIRAIYPSERERLTKREFARVVTQDGVSLCDDAGGGP